MEIGQTQEVTAAQSPQVPANTQQTETAPQAAPDADFQAKMLKVLGRSAADSVNEEELFAGLIEERLAAIDENAASAYREAKQRFMEELKRPSDGYVQVEDAANRALESLVADGTLDSETASTVKNEAFRAAQLDDNLEALYDSRGSENDPTIAVASMEEAMLKIAAALEGIESGEIDVTEPAEASTTLPFSGPQELDGEGGFLWKPVSESDGNLVVLLPTELREMIERVEIHSALPATAESLLASGRFAGDEHNGERLHYRFDEPGADYGDNVYVVAYAHDGTEISWNIAQGGERQD